MAIDTYRVAHGNHDGRQLYGSRTTGTVELNATLPFAPLAHFSDTSRAVHFYIFTITGMEQGRKINSARLAVSANNAWTVTGRTYIAVENNLDPLGTGGIVSGTAASMPWARVSRQDSAVARFGNRTGPTHSKPGHTLANYGASVRDPSALVYRAFADGRGVPAQTNDALTDDFGPALQALVNDPGWNPVSQSVLVWMFPDLSTGTDWIGSLAGFSWHEGSGVVGSSAEYVNAVGQIRMYDGYPDRAPAIVIDHESALSYVPLEMKTGKSISTGSANLTGSRKLVTWRGLRYDYPLSGWSWVIPGANADTDSSAIAQTSGNPVSGGDTPPGARVRNVSSNYAPSQRALSMESFANTAVNTTFGFGTGYNREYFSDNKAGVYSARFYYVMQGAGTGGNYPSPIRFRDSSGDVWFILLDHQANFPFETNTTYGRVRLTDAAVNVSTPWTTERLTSSNQMYRFEIQVDENRDPKVRVRIYLGDSTVPHTTLSMNPTSVRADRIMLGQSSSQLFLPQLWADLEVHANYDLSGEYQDPVVSDVGHPYVPDGWEWYEYRGPGDIVKLDDLGTATSIDRDDNIVALDPRPLTNEIDERRIYGAPDRTTTTVSYASGRSMDIHIPRGTPPRGGWPVFLWVHGGFFIGGSRTNIRPQLIDHITHAGWAVVSPSYNLSEPTNASPYPASAGKYPSHIVDIKLAGRWLDNNGPALFLNSNQKVVGGFSAGGYIAMGAFVSRGLTADGNPSPRNLTIAGNGGTGPDPVFQGCYTWGGPIDMQTLVDVDLAHPSFPTLLGPTPIRGGARALMGLQQHTSDSATAAALLGTSIPDLIEANSANLVGSGPMSYVWAESDYLIQSWKDLGRLRAACAGAGIKLSDRRLNSVNHDNLNWEFDPDHLRRFLDDILSPPPAPSQPSPPVATGPSVTSFGASTTGMQVNLPASVSAGDLLIAVASVRNPGDWSIGPGWVEAGSQSSGGVGELTVFYKVSSGSEPGQQLFTASVPSTAIWHVRKVTNWHGSTPPEVSTASSGGLPGSVSNPPHLSPSWGGGSTLWIAVGGAAAETVTMSAAPEGYSDEVWSSVVSGGASCAVGTSTRQYDSPGEDPGPYSTSASRWWYSATIAVRGS